MRLFDAQLYIDRRTRLCEEVQSGIIWIMGNGESACNYKDNTYPFRQNSNFLYYFGINAPDLNALLDCETGETVIYGHELTMDDIIWMGEIDKLSNLARKVGVTKIKEPAALQTDIAKAKSKGISVHFTPAYRLEHHEAVHQAGELGAAAHADAVRRVLEVVDAGAGRGRGEAGFTGHGPLVEIAVDDQHRRLRARQRGLEVGEQQGAFGKGHGPQADAAGHDAAGVAVGHLQAGQRAADEARLVDEQAHRGDHHDVLQVRKQPRGLARRGAAGQHQATQLLARHGFCSSHRAVAAERVTDQQHWRRRHRTRGRGHGGASGRQGIDLAAASAVARQVECDDAVLRVEAAPHRVPHVAVEAGAVQQDQHRCARRVGADGRVDP